MNIKYFLCLIVIVIFSCAGNGIELPESPEATTILWLEWLDNDNFTDLKKISVGNTLVYVEDMRVFFEGLPDDGVVNEATIVKNITCSTEGEKTECTYCCKDEEEETFILIKENGQWKVTDIIVALDDINEETLRQEKMLEEMLNKKLPNESEEL